jgi:hypothetical protein
MTGDRPELADGGLTAQLTEALRPLFPHASPSNGLVASCKPGHCWCGANERLQRALPMVRQYGDQRAAEALEAIAEAAPAPQYSISTLARARAAALREAADHDR